MDNKMWYYTVAKKMKKSRSSSALLNMEMSPSDLEDDEDKKMKKTKNKKYSKMYKPEKALSHAVAAYGNTLGDPADIPEEGATTDQSSVMMPQASSNNSSNNSNNNNNSNGSSNLQRTRTMQEMTADRQKYNHMRMSHSYDSDEVSEDEQHPITKLKKISSHLSLEELEKEAEKHAPKVVSVWKEFKQFAFQGSVIDLAVGIIVGGAFGKLVTSLVDDIIMPPIGWLLSGVDFANLFMILKRGKKNTITKGKYKSLNQAKEDGAVTMNVGVFLNSLINFVVISVIIFTMVRTINNFKRQGNSKARLTMRECPYCYSEIDSRAIKCGYCTTDLPRDLRRHRKNIAVSNSSDDEDNENTPFGSTSAVMASGASALSSSMEPAQENNSNTSNGIVQPKSALYGGSSKGRRTKEEEEEEERKLLKELEDAKRLSFAVNYATSPVEN